MKSLDLIKIINACKTSGVESLSFDGLQLRFKTGETVLKGQDSESVTTPTELELRAAEEMSDEERKQREIDDALATLQIDDPARFEELLVERELEFSAEPEEELNDQ